MYGPTPGGGLVGSFFIGVPAGTSPSAGNASTLSNGPYGGVRWITILPVALLVVIPGDRLRLAVRERGARRRSTGVMN